MAWKFNPFTANFDYYETPVASGAGHVVQDEGTPLTQRTNLNFVGAGVAVTDDAGNDATIVTINGGGGGGTWGSITGTLSSQTDLQTALDAKVDENVAIVGATKTKITYDAKGLVTSGADATSTDITDFTEAAQDAVGGMVDSTLVYTDATPVLKRAPITGDVTIADGSNVAAIGVGVIVNNDINASAAINATKIADGSVTNAEFQYINSLTSNAQTQLDNKQPLDADLTTIAGLTATTDNFMQAKAGAWASRTVAQVKTDLGLTGTNSGDVTLAGTPDYITISGQTITRNKLDLVDDLNTFTSANLATMLTDETGSGANVFAVSPNLTGTPSIQQTSPINNPPYSVVSDEPTTNLILNPSFEVNITDGWSDTGTVTRTRDTTDKFVGDASMKMVTSAVDSGAITGSMAVTPSVTYVLSCWVKGSVGGESVQLTITGNSSGASSSKDPVAFFTTQVTTSWKRIRFYKTMSAGDTTATCSIRSVLATAQTIFVDGVQFEQKGGDIVTGDSGSADIWASAYCDGSLGNGHSWSGTAHNSTSSRVAGVHFLAPIAADSQGSFIQRTDGSIAGKMTWRNDWTSTNVPYSAGLFLHRDEPFFPYEFSGHMMTNVKQSGVSAGLLLVENTGPGISAYFKGATTSDYMFVLDAPSITTGSIMAVFAAADVSTMVSNGGKFFEFADKNDAIHYQWTPVFSEFGATKLNYQNRYTFLGGGGMTSTNRTFAGQTVATTSGVATVTGTGTAFLTDFRRGDSITIPQGGFGNVTYQVVSVASDTSLTINTTASATVSLQAFTSKTRQYYPANLQLSGAYGDHSGAKIGDFLYNVFPNGSNGQLHVMKSSAVASKTPPTENAGDALVTKRYGSTATVTFGPATTENTIISGYTTPALELYQGKLIRIKFYGDSDSTNATDTITWRVKIGSTTVLTSAVRQVGTANLMSFTGEIVILGTSTTHVAQRIFLNITGQDTTTVTAADIYTESKTATSTVDLRTGTGQAITVTAQYGGANGTMNVYNSTMEIV